MTKTTDSDFSNFLTTTHRVWLKSFCDQVPKFEFLVTNFFKIDRAVFPKSFVTLPQFQLI
ncbi:hypothetical protein [Limosilactobacillus fermentum]|uniref:hypothetical protein n=1 Tax=Limosilactobacillus fermentum TaxID=1613 RepID=UPI0021A5F3DD|nr:hypothetical protein [Limosilactobacillus fermentum]